MSFTTTDLLIAGLLLRKEIPAHPVADNLALVEQNGLNGEKKKAVTWLKEREDWTPTEGRPNEGLKKGTYTVSGVTAALLGGTEVEVRWYKRPNLHPAIWIDGERVMSKDDPERFRNARRAVQRGVAVKVS